MSGDDFFNFDDTPAGNTETPGHDGSANWIFGGGGDDDDVGGASDAVNPGTAAENFELPVLKGQLFGTDGDGGVVDSRGGAGNGEEVPLTLSQLMSTETEPDFAFDLSYGAHDSSATADALFVGVTPSHAHSKPGPHTKETPNAIADKSLTKSPGHRNSTKLSQAGNLEKHARSDGEASASVIREGKKKNPNNVVGGGMDIDAAKYNVDQDNNKRVKWSETVIGDKSDGELATANQRGKRFEFWDQDFLGGGGDHEDHAKASGQKSSSTAVESRSRRDGPDAIDLSHSRRNDAASKIPKAASGTSAALSHRIGSPSSSKGSVDSSSIRQHSNQRLPQHLIPHGILRQQPGKKGSNLDPKQQIRSGSSTTKSRVSATTPFVPESATSKSPQRRNLVAANQQQKPREHQQQQPTQQQPPTPPNRYKRPIAETFERLTSGLRPLIELENSFVEINAYLDELDAKCDARLEELEKKKKAYLEATKMLRNAFH